MSNKRSTIVRTLRLSASAALLALAGVAPLHGPRVLAQGTCGSNPIVCENQKTGAPSTQWDVTGGGDPSIQGFANDISVNHGDTVRFKVKTDAAAYRIDIYRLGYYGGSGARFIATVSPSVSLPQFQADCRTDAPSGLVDCGTWQDSASWFVPADAVSGIYVAKLVRTDTNGSNHIYFVVRADESRSDLLFQTSDTTWQAYNSYGGNSLYTGGPGTNPSRAYKVSYNRPFNNRASAPNASPFASEYPMVRWLEANGYDVSYFSGVDTDRFGSALLGHKAFLSIGHDEYWSGGQRANVEAARSAGVNLAFFSGNEAFWKTRWEPSIDGSGTPYRTLVSYKETHANQKIDPDPSWTGTWRDPRFSPPSDGGRPDNALTGSLYTVDCCTAAIQVPAAFGQLRFWRNTSVATLAAGTTATLAQGTLGYEWNEDVDNGSRPAGVIDLSSTTVSVPERVLDFGSTYAPGTATHSVTLYRAASGALVFSAGTIQWSWGLDVVHDNPTGATSGDVRMQQATVNVLADMNAQPATLRSGLVASAASADQTAPASTITSPTSGASIVPQGATAVQIAGTARDQGGIVAGVEVSVDGGATWHPAIGRESWTFAWTPTRLGSVTIKSRAVDDSGNIETPAAGVTVTIQNPQCPCSLWDPAIAVPSAVDFNDTSAIEVGVKVRSDFNGFITGLRFYKTAANTGTHIANLWTASGTLLATAAFSSETASGWQEVAFASPVAVTANTVYVASYHTDAHYVASSEYFATAGVDTPVLHAPASGTIGNGVYRYGPSAFPSATYKATNYWVDAVFYTALPGDTTPPTVTATSPAAGATNVSVAAPVTATFSEPLDPATVAGSTFDVRDSGGALVAATVAYDAPTRTATLTPASALAWGATYTARVHGGSAAPHVTDSAGNPLAADVAWSFTTTPSVTCPCSLWDNAASIPAVDFNDNNAIEVGVKVRSDVNGFITGLRFYKVAANTGQHIANLWTTSGTLLATAVFNSESASGWQEVAFASPVAVTANTLYVASYHTSGHYVATSNYFATAGVDTPILHAPASGTLGNGVYRYGPTAFPNATYNAANYWVDVVFNTTTGPDTTPPTVTATSPAAGATSVGVSAAVTATFSEALDPATVTGSTFDLRDGGGAPVPATVAYDASTRTATLTPASSLAWGTTFTARVHGGAAAPHVTDAAGNPLAADVAWSFTTLASVVCPCSLWNNAPSISGVDFNDPGAIEVGVKVRADVNGFITGLRFYKAAANTGQHIANLWTTSGTLLATAVFNSETASGWQEVSFASPVAVTANTLYVASYHTTAGHYVATSNYFASSGVDTAVLHAPATGTVGNGVYGYGPSAFPNATYNAANYWVDVVFNTTTGGTPPTTFVDATAADFGRGSPDASIYTSLMADGELTLQPTVASEFTNPVVPTGWSTLPWTAGSSVVVGGGVAAIDGLRLYTDATFSTTRSLEFSATFSGAPYEHVGFGVTLDDAPWAIFSSGPGDGLYARTNNGTSSSFTRLPGNWFGAPHRFRIDSTASGVVYAIDGVQVASDAIVLTANVRPIASDYASDGTSLKVDWLRMTPYASAATYTSRIFDAAATVSWTGLTWTGEQPAGTSVVVSVRSGDTPTPDGSWTPFATVTNGTVNTRGRYLQYRVDLSTSNPARTPVVADVTVSYQP